MNPQATTSLRTLIAATVAAALLPAGPLHAAACPPLESGAPAGLHAVSSSGELWRLLPRRDQGIAEAEFIGDLTDGTTSFYPTDIAFNDEGVLHAVDGYDLICIDPATARATKLDVSDPAVARQTGLAGRAGALGQLYAAGGDRLVRIDVQSGAQVPLDAELGALKCGDEIGDLVFSPSHDVLYGTIECTGSWKGIRSHLVVVDPAAGAIVKDVGPIVDTTGRSRYATFGLAFGVDGALHAGSDDVLMRIDPATGLSKEDLVIISRGQRPFSRVDGLASRVCDTADGRITPGLTAADWRAQCPSPDGSLTVDPWVARVTGGMVGTACEALGVQRVATRVDRAPRGLNDRDVRRIRQVDSAVSIAPAVPLGLEPSCAAALTHATAAALNLASGKVNAACLSCKDVDAGSAVSEIGDLLKAAIDAGDEETCTLLAAESRRIIAGGCF